MRVVSPPLLIFLVWIVLLSLPSSALICRISNQNLTIGYYNVSGANVSESFVNESIINITKDLYVNETGDTMTGQLNMSGNILTEVGELIVEGLTTGQNIVPDTDSLYSLGNATLWWDKVYANKVYSQFVNASQINSTDLNSDRGDFQDNITIAGYKVMKIGNDMVVRLA